MRVAGGVADVSNICWSASIPPFGKQRPVLARLAVVREAWVRQFGSDASLILIADKSLRWQLDSDGRAEFARMVRDGVLSTAPTADPELLTLARDRGLHVLSRDQFLDLRRAHPWIERSAERFLAWRHSSSGLRFVSSGIVAAPAQVKSRAEEAKELGWQNKIDVRDPRHLRILRTDWRCTARDCRLALAWPDRLLLWPRLSTGGRALCPNCRCELEDVGPRGPVRVVAVALNDVEKGGAGAGAQDDENIVLRFPLAQGDAVVLGRGELAHGINLGAPELAGPDARRRMSRRHAVLVLEDAGENVRWTATDLGSANGSVVEYAGTGTSASTLACNSRELVPGHAVVLGERDSLVLGGPRGLRIRLSGRRYFAEESALPRLGSQGSSATTVSD